MRTEIETALGEFVAARRAGRAQGVDEFCRAREHLGPELRERIEDAVFVLEGLGAPRAPRTAAASDPAGATLGDFRIVREIGRGGMGVVYEAEQISLRRTVALKVLPAHFTVRPETVERFRREASMAARLQHPGIVAIHAIGEEGGTHFFAMELVDGTPLDRRLDALRESKAAGRPVGSKEAIETACGIALQVADALAHAHRSGVLHRDVKPSNILVRRDGSAVLTDFGIARDEGLPSLTATGELSGTAYYVSPEQAQGGRVAVDHRSDVYSLGVTLFELLTLRRPFEGSTVQEVLCKIATVEAPDPRRLAPELATDLATIVRKALEKDPPRRYASADALADDVRAFLEYRPIRARPVSAVQRALRWARREPAKAALLVVLVISIPALGALGLSVRSRQEEVAAARAQARIERVEGALEEGYEELGGRRLAETQARFERALAEDAGCVEAIAGISLVQLYSGRPEEALALLDARSASSGASRALDRIRSTVLAALGRRDEAESLERGLGEPRGALELFLEGERLRRIGKGPGADRAASAQAVALLTRAVRVAPRPRALYEMRLARAAADAGDRDAARDSVEALEAHWPESARSWLTIGIVRVDFDAEGATAAFRRAAELDPGYGAAYANLGRMLSHAGDYDGAVAACRRAMELDPSLREAPFNLAAALNRLGDSEGTLAALLRALEIDPSYASAHHLMGRILLRQGDHAASERSLRLAVEAEPDLAGAHADLAVVLERRGDGAGAIDAYRRALQARSGDAGLSLRLGRALRRAGDLPGAILALQEAREGPEELEAMRELAACAKRAGDRPVNLRAWERIAELRPSDGPAASQLAGAQYDAGDLAGALASCRRAVELLPQSAQVRFQLGFLLDRSGDPEAAIVSYREGLALDPEEARAHHDLGRLLEATGDDSGAAAAYRRALEREPRMAAAHGRLVGLLRRTGDDAALRAEQERWAAAGPPR